MAARPLGLAQQDRRRAAAPRATCRRRWRSYQASLAIGERLAGGPGQRRVAARPLGVPRARSATCRWRRAICRRRWRATRSLAISERLAKADPGNAGWQRDLSVTHNKIGNVQVAQGDLPAALTSYQASLAIRDRLAKADPGNAGWQRDLSVSHDRIGDVQVEQGDLPAALTSYQASLAISRAAGQGGPGKRRLAARPRIEPRPRGHGQSAARRA